ncbi:unnamed protein product [Lepidochelys kempii]
MPRRNFSSVSFQSLDHVPHYMWHGKVLLETGMMHRNRDLVKKGEVRPYEFLELLVLCESKSKISDKVKKVRNMVVTFREDFEENLRSLLADPDEQVAIHLKQNLQLQERWLFPRKSKKTVEPKAFYRGEQEKSFRKTKPAPPRSVSEPGIRAVGSEKWTLVTPVPHLKCHCYTQRISAPILSKEEIQAVEREKKDLQYQMLTLEARVMRALKWKMDVYLPSYKKRVAAVSTSVRPKTCADDSPKNSLPHQCVRKAINTRKKVTFPLSCCSVQCFQTGSYKGKMGELQSSKLQPGQEDEGKQNKETQRDVGAKVASREGDQYAFQAGKQYYNSSLLASQSLPCQEHALVWRSKKSGTFPFFRSKRFSLF